MNDTNAAAPSYDVHHDLMEKAWALVNPRAYAEELEDRGLLSAASVAKVSWKDPISALVTDEDLATAGVTIDQVREAIIYFTATEPRITREKIGGKPWVHHLIPLDGWLVTATGYLMGPAGP
jgi:hypothetical protein